MTVSRTQLLRIALLTVFIGAAFLLFAGTDNPVPVFGRDTVLVWNIQTSNYEASFIARIAMYSPDRFLEWEDGRKQGTLILTQNAILEAKGYDHSKLFVSGMDKKSNNTTALWLSEKIFLELKEKKKIRIYLDGVMTKVTYIGEDRIPVEVNRTVQNLPVIKLQDDHGIEWCFWDRQDNPLLVRQSTQNYSQTLVSITTDRSNTLRWIKGKKLLN
jgi:hypothetical protein